MNVLKAQLGTAVADQSAEDTIAAEDRICCGDNTVGCGGAQLGNPFAAAIVQQCAVWLDTKGSFVVSDNFCTVKLRVT